MSNRNHSKERKLVNDWSYFKPTGPHFDDNEVKRLMKNLDEMDDRDVKRLIEIGDEMQEYISKL